MTLRRHHVLIAGGGVAGVEAMLALRALAPHRVAITMLSSERDLIYRPVTVGEAFGRAEARVYPLRELLADAGGGELIWDSLQAVEPDAHRVLTGRGEQVSYDTLIVAIGATMLDGLPGALTFRGRQDVPALRELIGELGAGSARSVAFTLPSQDLWPLPIYELALMTGAELRGRVTPGDIWIVTPEEEPLELFGPAAARAIVPMLSSRRIRLRTATLPAHIEPGRLVLAGGGELAVDRVVALPALRGPGLPGLPCDERGFIPADAHGRVFGLDGVYAAGDTTTFPLKQGGLAAQQADAVVQAIAAELGLPGAPAPFSPVLRGLLMTDGAPLYLRSEPHRLPHEATVAIEAGRIRQPARAASAASDQPLWWPPVKIAGRYLGPFLATARPQPLGSEPLIDRVAAPLGRASEAEHQDALELALLLADCDARWGDYDSALQALQAAQDLQGALPPEYEARRRQWIAAARA
jgi:sulfide:quinone oxidoreductase